MSSSGRLGEFLRARRAGVRPSDVGLVELADRRVGGLRREEVATLAAISEAYYIRLEQGRERNPSEQVVSALARALRLDADAETHLLELAHGPRTSRHRRDERYADPALVRMMSGWPRTPALILGRSLDVLATNAAGSVLFPGLIERGNMLIYLFDDDRSATLHHDWQAAASYSVAALRAESARAHHDDQLVRLVGQLSIDNDQFRRMWARHDVKHKTHRRLVLNHPNVGEFSVEYQTFTVNAAPSQSLIVYQAPADDHRAEAALSDLARLADAQSPAVDDATHPGRRTVPTPPPERITPADLIRGQRARCR